LRPKPEIQVHASPVVALQSAALDKQPVTGIALIDQNQAGATGKKPGIRPRLHYQTVILRCDFESDPIRRKMNCTKSRL
jgi:hypothetical protein